MTNVSNIQTASYVIRNLIYVINTLNINLVFKLFSFYGNYLINEAWNIKSSLRVNTVVPVIRLITSFNHLARIDASYITKVNIIANFVSQESYAVWTLHNPRSSIVKQTRLEVDDVEWLFVTYSVHLQDIFILRLCIILGIFKTILKYNFFSRLPANVRLQHLSLL